MTTDAPVTRLLQPPRLVPVGQFHQGLIDQAAAELKLAEEQERLRRIRAALDNTSSDGEENTRD